MIDLVGCDWSGNISIAMLLAINSLQQDPACYSLTHLLMFTWKKELVDRISLIPTLLQCGKLRVAEHQFGVQKTLDEPDTTFPLEVGFKLISHHIT